MGTIADKLTKLNATKADLKAALAEKGQTVGDVFSTYPAAVRAIDAGGGTSRVEINAPYGGGSRPLPQQIEVYYSNGKTIINEMATSDSPITINVLTGSFITLRPSMPPLSSTGDIQLTSALDVDAALVLGDGSISSFSSGGSGG